MSKCILSICVPTCNRVDLLKNSLISICSQIDSKNRDFVELLVSDNGSTDGTEKVVAELNRQYNGCIHYVKQKDPLTAEGNFEYCMRTAKGDYRKLINNSVIWAPGSVDLMLDILTQAKNSEPVIIFSNGLIEAVDDYEVIDGVDDFVRIISYNSTWIGCFGIWLSQLNKLDDFGRAAGEQLIQADALLRLIDSGNKALICNQKIFSVQNVGRKGGYSISQVFGRNYLGLLKQYRDKISGKTFNDEKRKLLLNHILPYYFSGAHDFVRSDILKDLFDYRDDIYFYKALQSFKISEYINAHEALGEIDLELLWRFLNSDNKARLGRVDCIDRVHIGKHTYGVINMSCWATEVEFLKIGCYVSIADNVEFVLGGNHYSKGLTTYPVKVHFLGAPVEAESKGPIIVSDDVWIGKNVIIHSGVKIGQGAIIASGSVVVKDVMPYSVVGGNPARHIKYRFDDENIRSALLKIDFSALEKDFLIKNENIIYGEINSSNIDRIMDLIRAQGAELVPNGCCTSDLNPPIH